MKGQELEGREDIHKQGMLMMKEEIKEGKSMSNIWRQSLRKTPPIFIPQEMKCVERNDPEQKWDNKFIMKGCTQLKKLNDMQIYASWDLQIYA